MIDNIDLYLEHEAEQERRYQRWLEGRPICEYCLCPIEEKYAYWVDEKWICESCIDEYMEDEHRERVPDET